MRAGVAVVFVRVRLVLMGRLGVLRRLRGGVLVARLPGRARLVRVGGFALRRYLSP